MDNDENGDTSKQTTKISFGFSKQIKSKVVTASAAQQHGDEGDDLLTSGEVTHIENGLINGQEKPKKKEPVIGRQQQSDWRIERLQQIVNDGTATEQQQALLALLKEGLDVASVSASSEKEALELQPQVKSEVEEPDYDQISYTDFGAAFLRGRGWKKGEGVGRTNKRVVPLLVNAKGKTFDLGLKKKKTGDSDEQEIPLGVGVGVKILYGKYEGKYGRVENLDASTGRCEVKLPDGEIQEVVEKLLKTVTDQEYTEQTRVSNKAAVDRHQQSSGVNDKLSSRLQRRLSISKDDSDEEIQVLNEGSGPPWAVPDLLVRVISKRYKDGRYYKTKMMVVDAPSKSQIELRDDRGHIHTLDQSSIETVIPRNTGGQVMILKGRQKGRVGQIVNRDDKRYQLKVQIKGLRDVLRVDFDDACEYRGNSEEMDYD